MKIVFKRIASNKIDLSKVFPIVEEADYKLLEGQNLIIPDAEYEKIQKKGYLDIGPYQISKDLIEVAAGQNYDPVHAEILAEVGKKSIFMDEMADVLVRGVKRNMNIILYGRGGHNKSEGTMQIIDLMKAKGLVKDEPFVMTCGDGLTEETLFGGIDIKEFKDTGKLKYLFNNSFLDHEVVIFEEIFDAPPQILLSLKDIMTSGWARKGNQKYRCKTKLFIGLTNKSKEDFSEDDSLEALAQRFPLTLKVEWPDYSKNNWIKLFKAVFGQEFFDDNKFKLQELGDILAMNNQANNAKQFVSPRTAIHAAKLYCDGGDLKYISDIDKSILAAFYKENKDREAEQADAEMFKMINDYVANNNLGVIDTNEKILEIILGEHKARTGEDIVVEKDEESNKVKVKKLEYVLALMNIHNWSKSNVDKAKNKIQEMKDLVSEIKKNNK